MKDEVVQMADALDSCADALDKAYARIAELENPINYNLEMAKKVRDKALIDVLALPRYDWNTRFTEGSFAPLMIEAEDGMYIEVEAIEALRGEVE